MFPQVYGICLDYSRVILKMNASNGTTTHHFATYTSDEPLWDYLTIKNITFTIFLFTFIVPKVLQVGEPTNDPTNA